jgi:UDP-2-acetamido-2,6-beta-L-arabino-hexul-4-ose reductase
MIKVLITGSNGFVGKNLLVKLQHSEGFEPVIFDIEQDEGYLNNALKKVDFVFHLAGVNRPEKDEEFVSGNVLLTRIITERLIKYKNLIPVVLTSSKQAESDCPYGKSKLEAEHIVRKYIKQGGTGYIYRLTNVFGKWCKPNYNSVVATFCHNIATGKEISISDPDKILDLVHVDDVIEDFISILTGSRQVNKDSILSVGPIFKITLGRLAELIYSFREMSHSSLIPDLSDDFSKKLHSTYLSYIPVDQASFLLNTKTDDRGYIFELIRSKAMGQIFVSHTKSGITRGNHFHNLKNEKFCVIEGKAVIRFRHLITNEIYSYEVSGTKPEVVNILPGYTHSITNTGKSELITLFWANEPFDPERPDTYFEKV